MSEPSYNYNICYVPVSKTVGCTGSISTEGSFVIQISRACLWRGDVRRARRKGPAPQTQRIGFH